jgi:hypothetical protein
MVSNSKNAAAIGFNESGTAIELRDLEKLRTEVLPRYFVHNHVSSFARQLNSYDFKTKGETVLWVKHLSIEA